MYNKNMSKKILTTISVLIIIGAFFFYSNKPKVTEPTKEIKVTEVKNNTETAMLANPATEFCKNNKGTSEIVSNPDGSQFGMCHLENFSCEEWVYYRGECTVDADAEKIKQALISSGLDMSDMKVTIKKHLGNYIQGSVDPITEPAGGGYVFAVKNGSNIEILADGNGIIPCNSFTKHPDFSKYLIPQCVDKDGNLVKR